MAVVRSLDFRAGHRAPKPKSWPASIDRERARGLLLDGLRQSSIMLDDQAVTGCIDHVETLVKWNRVQNLSAIRETEDIVVKHLLDSFSILQFVQGPNVIDVGSGAGFPGIPLALAKPECRMVLLDSSMKKTEFLRHSVARMGLGNIEVICERLQDFSGIDRTFDTVIARALGPVSMIAELGLPILSSAGRILAMKGRHPAPELDNLTVPCDASVHQLNVPGLDAERHLVVLKKNTC